MNYLIFNDQIPTKSFLQEKLGIHSYSNIVLGKSTYLQKVLQTLNLSHSNIEILLLDHPLETVSDLTKYCSDHQLINNDDAVFYWDLRLFPLDGPALNSIIQKSLAIENNVNFSNAHLKNQGKYIRKISISTFSDRESNNATHWPPENEIFEIDISGLVIDINSPGNATNLFANNLDARYFNDVEATDYYFIKKSSNKKKIRAEYNFLQNIPENVKVFYPRIHDFIENEQIAQYSMERIFSFDVSVLLKNATIFLDDNLETLFYHLNNYLSLAPKKTVTQSGYQESLSDLFVTKVADRFVEIQKLPFFAQYDALCKLNGFVDVFDFHQRLEAKIKMAIKTTKKTQLIYSHGDLCASNILFDVSSRQIKLVDPRGFSDDFSETFRPIEYELAKLSHSFLGLYDLIICDAAEILVQEGQTVLQFKLSAERQIMLQNEFLAFLKNKKIDIHLLRLYESTLFFSMIPLHQDHPKRTLAQLARSLECLKLSEE